MLCSENIRNMRKYFLNIVMTGYFLIIFYENKQSTMFKKSVNNDVEKRGIINQSFKNKKISR